MTGDEAIEILKRLWELRSEILCYGDPDQIHEHDMESYRNLQADVFAEIDRVGRRLEPWNCSLWEVDRIR